MPYDMRLNPRERRVPEFLGVRENVHGVLEELEELVVLLPVYPGLELFADVGRLLAKLRGLMLCGLDIFVDSWALGSPP